MNVTEIKKNAARLKAGQRILLSGNIYTARDAAHKRIFELLHNKQQLPFEIKDAVIYYAGPTQAPEGLAIGSCGPTTSSRMDSFTPTLLDMGLAAMIGKGERSVEVCKSIQKNSAVYLCALGGAGALACKSIKSCEVIAFEDLGCESVKRLYIEDFSLFVAVDAFGGNLFESGRASFAGRF